MKTARYKDNSTLTISDLFPVNKKLCRYCSKPLTGKQSKWCSKTCALNAFNDTMLARGSSKHIREKVYARDNGICAKCGVDCKKLQRISDKAYCSLLDYKEDAFERSGWRPFMYCYASPRGWGGEISNNIFEKQYFKDCRKIVAQTPLSYGLSCWQADHIVECVNGGSHSMDNLQTLCNSCHKAKTRTIYKKGK